MPKFSHNVAYSMRNANSVSLDTLLEAELLIEAILVHRGNWYKMQTPEKQTSLINKDPNFLTSIGYTDEVPFRAGTIDIRSQFRLLAKRCRITAVDSAGTEYFNHRAIVDGLAQLAQGWLHGQNRKTPTVTRKPQYAVDNAKAPVFFEIDLASRELSQSKLDNESILAAAPSVNEKWQLLRKKANSNPLPVSDIEQELQDVAKIDAVDAELVKVQQELAEKKVSDAKQQREIEALRAENAKLTAPVATNGTSH